MNIKIPNVPDRDFFVTFLRLINISFSHLDEDKMMTEAELQCLSYFFLLPYEKFKYQFFSLSAKNRVRKSIIEDGWKVSKVNLNNKLYSLRDKGFLYKDEDNITHLNKTIFKTLERIHREGRVKINFDVE